jgi:capsular exopolysaccharide synthesis family protein
MYQRSLREKPVELRDYLEILWRRKWVVAVTVAVTVTVVVIGTFKATPKYVATATLRVATPPTGSVGYVEYNIEHADRLMSTYARIATSGPVLEELVKRLGLDRPPKIEVATVANTELMTISAEDQDPVLARDTVNTLAEILVARSRELYTGGGEVAYEIIGEQLTQIEGELDQARAELERLVNQSPEDAERITAARRSIELKEETYSTLLGLYEQARVAEAVRVNTLSVIEPAVTPQTPSQPRRALNIAFGFMVGLAGGVGLAFLFENLDTTLYTVEQIEQVTELSALGEVPTAGRQQQINLLNGYSSTEEAFRRLRTNIFALGRDVPLHTLLVTSAEPGEGKSTIVINLASTIAQSGRKVIVVDSDLRLPTLHKMFGLANETGLSSILNQEVTLDKAVQESNIDGVEVLTSGPLPPNPDELLDAPGMIALLQQLTQQFDMVLLDTPALLAVADAAILAPAVDGVILVVERAQARQETVRVACRQLAAVKARSISIVVNRAEQRRRYHYPPDAGSARVEP